MPANPQNVQSGPGGNYVDPTTLTTQQLLREVTGIRELYDSKLASLTLINELVKQVIETRLTGMDRAIELTRVAAEHMITGTDEKMTALRAIYDEKFDGVEKQFKERDVRTEQNAIQTKVAVDAALQAAEKAVGKQQESFSLATSKSEAATTKQIDQITDLMRQGFKMTDDRNNDLKERLTLVEGRGEGAAKQVTTTQTSGNFIMAIIGVVIAVVIGGAAIAISLGLRR